jgi:hypothetical protein
VYLIGKEENGNIAVQSIIREKAKKKNKYVPSSAVFQRSCANLAPDIKGDFAGERADFDNGGKDPIFSCSASV